MLKRFTILLLLTLGSRIGNSQSLTLGVKGGLNYATQTHTYHLVNTPSGPRGEERRTRYDYKTGFKLGAFTQLALTRFLSLAPGLLWNQQGYQYTYKYHDPGTSPYFFDKPNRVTLHYLALDVPFMFKLPSETVRPYVSLGVRVETPIGYSQSLKESDVPDTEPNFYDYPRDYYQEYQRITVGLLTAIGAERNISPSVIGFIELEYNPSLTKAYATPGLDMQNTLFALNAGVKWNKN